MLESASSILKEFPKLSLAERGIIAEKQWESLEDHERYKCELKARLENEKTRYSKIRQFYDERI